MSTSSPSSDSNLHRGGVAASPDTASPDTSRDSTRSDGPTASADARVDPVPIPATGMIAEDSTPDPNHRFVFWTAMPAWLISMLAHCLLLIVLGLVTITDPVQIVNVLSASVSTKNDVVMEEFEIEVVDPSEIIADPDSTSVSESIDVSEPITPVTAVSIAPATVDSVPLDPSDFSLLPSPAATPLHSVRAVSMQPLGGRSRGMREGLLEKYGGNAASEAAVTEALMWFSRHQMPNGGWTFAHNTVCRGACGNPGDANRARVFNGATAMALLPFLGAGHTHVEGDFQPVVARGLRFLIDNGRAGKKNGMPLMDLRGAGDMYSHGLAAIVLCEAYAMTGDRELLEPAQASLNFISLAQCRDGGWRYEPREIIGGDTSVAGWQIMALKSGHMGNLNVTPLTIDGARSFLSKVGNGKGAFGYDRPVKYFRRGTTAIGLLCQMYMGWRRDDPRIQSGVELLTTKRDGEEFVSENGVSFDDIYYDYYAAQVLRQYGGPEWDAFNEELRDWLVSTQSQSGGAKGSWMLPIRSEHGVPKTGGRLAVTSFATMILEVYYRHMPLYADQAIEDEFPL